MGGKDLLHGLAAAILAQLHEHGAQAAGRESGDVRKVAAMLVGFEFGAVVEALFEQERRDFGDGLVELGEVGAAFRHEGIHPAEELSTGDDLHGVPAVDVLDLVPEHTGQPVIGIQFLVEPAGDEHSSAGRGVGVDRVGGEQGETPVQVLSVGIAGEGLAQDVDADRGGFVAPEAAEAPDDFEGDRVTDGDFLFERESRGALDHLAHLGGGALDLFQLVGQFPEVRKRGRERQGGGQPEQQHHHQPSRSAGREGRDHGRYSPFCCVRR
jgi:hypothetical protein